MQLQGIGTSASILQGDIVACGPSIIHVIDQASGCWRACQAMRRWGRPDPRLLRERYPTAAAMQSRVLSPSRRFPTSWLSL